MNDQPLDPMQEYIRCRKEFADFAYKASHDLQAPLRTIVGFTNLLKGSAYEKLNSEEKEEVDTIIKATKHAQALLDGLLQYSRLNTISRPFLPISASSIVKDVLEGLKDKIKELHATISVDPLPIITADIDQLHLLFKHLIDNALKFHKPGISPVIHINASLYKENTNWLFCITDNGIGIDPKYHQRIFEVFRKLHAEEIYPGVGIGLTLAKKIVERHGGTIWVNSTPNQGTSICFTLPVTVTEDANLPKTMAGQNG